MSSKQLGLGLLLHRDSGGDHQNTPGQYVKWAALKAKEIGVKFGGKPGDIKKLMQTGKVHDKWIYFDYKVAGDTVSRPALDALKKRIREGGVTHLFIPDPDRLSRPDHPMEGIAIESEFRQLGVTIVYKTKTLGPLVVGQRPDIGELISSVVDFDRSGAFLHQHAEKMVAAKTESAENGHWAGGSAPFGYRRWLVTDSDVPVRQLDDGETVRAKGHHVEVLPDEEEFKIVLRILSLLPNHTASAVCRILDSEGIPSPNAGNYKVINGVKQKVSGKWNPPTVIGIARNPLLLGKACYGRRSMGKKRRLAPNGARPLTEDDFRPDGSPRVVRNPEELQVRGNTRLGKLVDQESHQELLAILDKRGASQRGKRKCQDPDANPLGGRIFDMACGWPMYKTKYQKNKKKTYKYRCGCYDKSKGQLCEHNCIHGPSAIKLVLSAIQQKLIQPRSWEALTSKIRELAQQDVGTLEPANRVSTLRAQIAQIEERLNQAKQSMAFAKNQEHFDIVSEVYETTKAEKAELEKKLKKVERSQSNRPSSDKLVTEALKQVERLHQVDLESDVDLSLAREIISLTNAQLFAKFTQVKWGKKRTVNRVAGGHITFGTAPPPIQKYDGPTDRDHLAKVAAEYNQKKSARSTVDLAATLITSGEAGSLGSKSRADWI